MNRDVVLCGIGAVGIGAGIYLVGRWLCKSKPNPYESNKLVNEYMAFHYTPTEEYMSYTFGPKDALDFPKKCAELCLKHKQEGVMSRALDIGCAVGRSSFELARGYSEVWGIDYSQAFIHKCQELKMLGQSNYWLTTEGQLGELRTAAIDPTIDRTKVHFTVGDACQLPDLGQFGCVFAGNLICRLPDPAKFLNTLPDLIVPGGTVIIASPYTWLQEYTPKDKWIGGYMDEDREVHGFDTLQQILVPNFDLIEAVDVPFLIRETVRKHQWTVAHTTVWRRKPATS